MFSDQPLRISAGHAPRPRNIRAIPDRHMLNRFSPAQVFAPSDVEQGFDLREILSFAWRRWKFIASVVGVALLIGTVSLMRQTALYTAATQVLLDPQSDKIPGPAALRSEVNLDLAMIESQMAIIRSSVFLRRVVEKEKLVSDPEFGSSPRQAPPIPIAARPASGDAQPVPPDILAATEALKGAVSVAAGPGYLIVISVTSADPARAARLSNAVADTYLVDKLDTRFEAAKRASTWLSDRLVELRNQLRTSEEAVTAFRTEHGLFQSSGNVTLNQQQLSELNAKLVEARADVAQKKARVDLLLSIGAKGGDPQSLPDISNGGALPSLRQQAATLSQQEADLLTRYGAPHPLVVNIRAQQRDVERAIAAELRRLAAGFKNEYELAQSRVASIERSMQQATGQTSIDDTTAIRLRELERTVAVNKSLFEDFLQRAKITQQESTFEPREARVITPALPPGAPSYPRKTQYLAVSLVIGLLLGVAGAVAKEVLNAGFTTPRQVEEMLGLPLLSSVSHMDARDLTFNGKVVPLPSYPVIKPLSRYSESIRALRSGIQMSDVDHPPKIVQVTSTAPGEGKTTIALSLAALTAYSGHKVLFIDADLRRPSASRFLGLQDEPGLVDLLLGQVKHEDVIRFHKNEGYWTLSAGNRTQNPPDLLGSDRMKLIVSSCRQTFDLVVIDTPPAGPVTDPLVVSQLCDKVVLVVRWAATAREMVKYCVQQLSGHKKIVGVVFNQVDDRQAQKYGKHAYYYGARYYKTYYGD
jgi:capsular exopolysaccharide synthesis family protein